MTGLRVKWAQVPEGFSPPKLPCFLPALAQTEREQTSPKAEKPHELSPPIRRRGRSWVPCTAGQPAPHPAQLPGTADRHTQGSLGVAADGGHTELLCVSCSGSLEHRNTFVFITVIIR